MDGGNSNVISFKNYASLISISYMDPDPRKSMSEAREMRIRTEWIDRVVMQQQGYLLYVSQR